MRSIPANYQPATDLLRDRVILITGAGDGIGATTARTFAAHGATVVLLGKTIPKLEAVYDVIVSAGHTQPAIYPMDLEGATYDDYENLAITLDQEFGQLDGLLHNAAILGVRMMVEQYDLKLWARVMHINLTAPFLLSRACLPVLRKSADARVVFTSTDVAQQGRAYWGAYGVSKAGADNLMQTMADELEANTTIRVNSIDPGAVATRIRRLAFPAEDASILSTADSVMPTYLYLFGPDSKNETGLIFHAQA